MNPNELLKLLGLYNTDALVETALRQYAVRNRPEVEIEQEDADGPIVETYSWVKNSRAGIEFGFDDDAAWIGLDETEFGKRPMVLTQIYLYGRHDGVRPYQEPLPFGLQLSDDRVAVRKKLDRFEATRHSHITDAWDTQEFRMAVAYANGESCIDFLVCMLREPPLPAFGYALTPVPSVDTMVALLGRPLDDSAVRLAFGTLGLTGRIDEIKDTGEADFLNPYGFLLEFAVLDETNNPSAKDFLLSSMTFVDERELGARRWPGGLPYGIRFGDSPETVVKKLGRRPDIQNDSDFSGNAIWYELKLTVNVLYDTMENRALRVTVTAPVLVRRIA